MVRANMWFLLGVFVGLLGPSVAVVEEYLNKSVNPCDDFYQYSCGRWRVFNSDTNLKHNDTLTLLELESNEKIADFLEKLSPQPGFQWKMKTFYDACRDVKEFNSSYFLDIVKPKNGWPALTKDWVAGDFNWVDLLAEVRKYGLKLILDTSVQPKWDNTSMNSIYIDLPFRFPEFPTTQTRTFADVLKRASIPEVEKISYQVVLFEKSLHSTLPPGTDIPMDAEDTDEVALSHLNNTLTGVNWVQYLSTFLGENQDLPTTVMIQNRGWMPSVVESIEKSDPEVVCNYIMVKFLQFIEQHVSGRSRTDCASLLHHSMPLAVGYVMEHNFYNPEYEQVLQEMFNFFKVDFLTLVSKWYVKQPHSLKFLYTKTSTMELQIGNAKRNLSIEEIDNYYENFHPEKGEFYKNVISAFAYKIRKELDSLEGEDVNVAYQWSVSPSPFFVHASNRIVVPLNLLHDEILNRDSVDKYSTLTFIIAHEFMHAFDMTGLHYDYEGNIYHAYIDNLFSLRLSCMQIDLNNEGLREKVADLGGVRLAFSSYRKTLTQLGMTLSSNASYSDRNLAQAFFIDFAQFFCGPLPTERPERITHTIHETDDVRVNEALMHFEEFANIYSCPKESTMNPREVCRIW